MAYDAEIRVGTKVDTSQMQKLQIQINKTTDKVAQLTHKMREMKNTEIPTDEYKEVQKQIEVTETKLNKLLEKKESFKGSRKSTSWLNMNNEIEQLQNSLPYLKGELQDLVDTGKAFTLGQDSGKYAELAKQRSYEMANLQALYRKQDEATVKQQNGGFKKMVSSAKKAFAALSSGAKGAFEKVSSVTKKAFGSMNKDVKKTNGLLATMRSRMQGLALSLLVFNQVTKVFNAMVNGAKEGIAEFAKYSKDCNAVLSDFKSSLQTMKFNLGAAFAPIVQTIVPYLTAFINVLNSVISKISQFFAVLTGSSTYYRAIQQQVDFAGSLEDTANAAKEAAGALAGFDKLNVVKQEDSSSSGSGGGGSSTGGGFEEVPIDSKIKELTEKVKEILAQLFAPLQEAWENQGQFVMESWKSALDEIWLLVKDIGRDFLIMWNEDETVEIFENLLTILGDIGLIIANLARNFREAWNENQNGLRIFEGIRDIIGIIVENIREAADATVMWAEDLNFSPLLEKISNWLESLEPVVDSLSGVLSDFYTQVLLPLAGWAVEEGLPDLLQVFIDFNNAVDWESLRTRLSEFWQHLEPFAEKIGEGLIIFIGDLSQKIAEFTQSETFKKMLDWLEEKMDSTTPEDIAKGIERIAKAIIFFKGVSLGLNVLSSISPAVATIKSLVGVFTTKGAAKGAEELTTAMLGTADATAGLTTGIGSLIGLIGELTLYIGTMVVGLEGLEVAKDKIAEANIAAGQNRVQVEAAKEAYDGWGGTFKALGDSAHGLFLGMQGLPNVATDTSQAWKAMEQAMKAIANGTIYTDEQLRKMQKTWGFTEEDIESLRQEMLDANPELRALADGFVLFDASAETLQDVSSGMKAISDGAVSVSGAAVEFQKPMWNMTEEAKQFFAELSNGNVTIDEYQRSLLEGAGYSQEFVNSLDNAFTGMEGFNSNAATAGLNAGLSLAKGLQDSKTDISTSIAGLSTQIETESSAMEQQTTDMGGSAIAGFINGITKNINTTAKPLNTLSAFIVKTIHDGPLKFGSPSKTTEGFGEDTITGYNNGITKNVSKTVAVIKSYMQTIQNTFKELATVLYEIGQDSMSALIKGLASKQSELKQTVKDMTELMGEAATASSGIKFTTGASTTSTLFTSASQLTTSSVMRGGNPYGATSSVQSASQTGNGISMAGIKQAMKEAMKESGGEYTFVAQLNGKTIYSETVKQDQIMKKSTGKSKLGN